MAIVQKMRDLGDRQTVARIDQVPKRSDGKGRFGGLKKPRTSDRNGQSPSRQCCAECSAAIVGPAQDCNVRPSQTPRRSGRPVLDHVGVGGFKNGPDVFGKGCDRLIPVAPGKSPNFDRESLVFAIRTRTLVDAGGLRGKSDRLERRPERPVCESHETRSRSVGGAERGSIAPRFGDNFIGCQRRRKNVPARRRKSVPRARLQLVPVVHGRDPRAGRCALRAAGGGPRVGGPVGPRGQAGGYSDGCRRRDRLCLSR